MALLERALGAIKQGLTPEKAALGLAVGAAIGVFPVLGTTTLLCVALGTALGLNHAVVQTANYAVSLVYFPALYGLMRLGEAVLGAPPLPLSPAALAARLVDDPAALLTSFGAAGVHALAGWFLAAPLLAGTVYAAGVPVLRAVGGRSRRPRAEHSGARLWRRSGGMGTALLRLFAPSLEVEYDGSTKRVRAYSGVSNVSDDSDEDQKVRIAFLPPSPEPFTPDPTSVAEGSQAQRGPAPASRSDGGFR